MIAVDTNILVYAHRRETMQHDNAVRWLRYLAEGEVPWAIPVFCLGEFLRVVTHRRIFAHPSTLEQATEAAAAILESPSVRVLNPSGSYYNLLQAAIHDAKATGNLVFDAQIAALCRENGIRRLLTEDRDFLRFSFISVVSIDGNPEI